MDLSARYNRWQGLAIAQLSVAVALLSALAIAGLGSGLSLLQNKQFMSLLECRLLFAASFPLFFLTATCSVLAVVTRTLDFRLTARAVRKKVDPTYARSLTMFWIGAETYGRITWFFFWLALLSFVAGGAAMAAAVASAYTPLLFGLYVA